MKQTILLFLVLSKISFAQIYNYDPIRHSNFETNPSFLSSANNYHTFNITHHGSGFSKGNFFSTNARFSMYNASYYTGIGFVAGHTNLNDSTNYSFIGGGIAYRTIMFGKIYTRIGLLSKMISVESSPGTFDQYSFASSPETGIKRYTGIRSNFSVSFSSPFDKYYVSAALLNYILPEESQAFTNFFPEYYVLNAGDLGKILEWRNWDINYTVFSKKYNGQNIRTSNHFATILWTAIHLSRETWIKIGTRAGWTDKEKLIASPIIQWAKSPYHRNSKRAYYKRKAFFLQFMLDLGYDPYTLKQDFNPTPQFNLTYLF